MAAAEDHPFAHDHGQRPRFTGASTFRAADGRSTCTTAGATATVCDVPAGSRSIAGARDLEP